MVCNYSKNVWCILFGMVVTGSLRTVTVKLAYQSGFSAPLTISLLYFFGQGLSIVVYKLQESLLYRYSEINDDHSDGEQGGGSITGLNEDSEKAIAWVHRIPRHFKPMIPALFNLMNSTLRWCSLIYVAAPVAEMLISGIELVLSVIAARIIRKRIISKERWFGVCLVTIGIILIGYVDYYDAATRSSNTQDNSNVDTARNLLSHTDYGRSLYNSNNSNSEQKDVIIGAVLIFFQCILSVLQDLSEEIFMQAKGSEVAATLILGIEGVFGFCVGLILYIFFGEKFGEDPKDTIQLLLQNKNHISWVCGLPLLFLLTGLLNIRSTEVTSSMTRNVWKNLRTLLVWILSLLIYCNSGDEGVGVPWLIPDSFYMLICFILMSVGFVVYYTEKPDTTSTATETLLDTENNSMTGKVIELPKIAII